MRRLKITHLTEYRYSVPVTLHPHTLRLRPREGPEVHIESSALTIFPAHRVKWHRDVLDNAVAVVEFLEAAQTLSITSEVVIQHYLENPLDFLVADYAVNYPFHYAPQDLPDLTPYLQLVYPEDQGAIRSWLDQLGLGSPAMQTYALLDRLSKTIASQFAYTLREEMGVQSPAQTLAWGRGSCRDFAALFVAACRCLGLASRFVSGYGHLPHSEQWSTTTHAWAEVYLPGPGWKGFDPTGGEVTGSRHIPVAVARRPEAVPPVAGSFFGMTGPPPALIVDVRVVAF
ncbi:transglutaminase [Desulfuromonas versatilis]|uniref:Transglutaminase n=1 Tax=Desulfuromonas versatilis TaxID=2802975 RepID=A0ABM8HW98_9BACT|nr:transglutaminase family protein [Desulfuromonas versatilis]BCR06207.1 transglutaminase [Desulfuromonas versatilis]